MSAIVGFFEEYAALITGVSGMIISVCALSVSVYSTAATRRHNRLSLRPHLDVDILRGVDGAAFTITLENNGTGTAVIQSYRVYVDEQQIKVDTQEAIGAALTTLFPASNAQWYVFMLGQHMAKDKKYIILEIRVMMAAVAEQALKNAARLKLVVDYRSVYGERFTLDSSKTINPPPLAEPQRN